MVLMFVYVFGSAMNIDGTGSHEQYVRFAMPGLFTMVMSFGCMSTAWAMAFNKERGFIDRFRSMPMAPSAVVTGRGVSDTVQSLLDLTVIVVVAHVVGWRAETVPAAIGAFGLLLLLRFALIWVGVFLGLLMKSAETAILMFALVFPFTMISSVFTPPSLMPGWLGAVAMWNPISSTANATRDLFGNPLPVGDAWIENNALLMSLLWPAGITVVFLTLSVWRYQRLGR
ncbi:ABC transporter permease [Actinophytocola sp. S1-96]|uniref:ABC transporter permease n=1 Tax=Actinophytocola gossypii TaxID=2812003 RepID=A0ABT2JH18_9PSEU|nr:ABC transporter permease [Actinophytocola gossypii]